MRGLNLKGLNLKVVASSSSVFGVVTFTVCLLWDLALPAFTMTPIWKVVLPGFQRETCEALQAKHDRVLAA